MAETLLKVAGLQAWYGESHILHGVDFDVARGEVVIVEDDNSRFGVSLTEIVGVQAKFEE